MLLGIRILILQGIPNLEFGTVGFNSNGFKFHVPHRHRTWKNSENHHIAIPYH